MSSFLRGLFNGLKGTKKAAPATAQATSTIVLQSRPEGALLFEKKSLPWWMKWFWGLLGMHIFMTASSLDLAWNNWSEKSTEPRPYAVDEDEEKKERYVLRSTYQRFSLASALFTCGCVACAVALYMRAQYVTSFGILSGPHRAIFVQTFKTGQKGYRIPMRECKLNPGRDRKDSKELVVTLQGKRYPWYLVLDGAATINGQKMTPRDAYKTIVQAWGQKYISEELTRPFKDRKRAHKGVSTPGTTFE